MNNSNPASVPLADQIADQLGQLRRLLALATPQEATQILARTLDYENGILGRVTDLVATSSRFAKVHSEHGVLPPEVWLALGRAAHDLDSVGADLAEHSSTIKQIADSSAAPSSSTTLTPPGSATVTRRRR